MMRKALTYAAVLIALELVVVRATNSGTLLTKGGSAATGLVRAFQGR